MTTSYGSYSRASSLVFVHLIAASHLISFQYGYRWTASSREEQFRHCAVSRIGWTSNNEFFGNLSLSLPLWF